MPLYKKKIGYVAGTEVRKAEAQVYGDNKKFLMMQKIENMLEKK